MNESKSGVKVLHFFNFIASDGVNFPHEFTAIAHDNGFTYLTNVVTAEQAMRRAERLLARIKSKKHQRELEGNPLNSDDYAKISQIGMAHYFAKSGATYPNSISLSEIEALEQSILNEKRIQIIPNMISETVSDHKDLTSKPLIGSLVLPPMTPAIMEDVEQVLNDYPHLLEELDSGGDITSSGMIELVFALVGSIHPDDPNGWVLDYLDENGNLKVQPNNE